MADDPHAQQRKDWRNAIAGLHRQQRIARQKWQRAAASPGAGAIRIMPPPKDEQEEEGTEK